MVRSATAPDTMVAAAAENAHWKMNDCHVCTPFAPFDPFSLIVSPRAKLKLPMKPLGLLSGLLPYMKP